MGFVLVREIHRKNENKLKIHGRGARVNPLVSDLRDCRFFDVFALQRN